MLSKTRIEWLTGVRLNKEVFGLFVKMFDKHGDPLSLSAAEWINTASDPMVGAEAWEVAFRIKEVIRSDR